MTIPQIDGRTRKGLISVGMGLENLLIDANTVSLMFFDNNPDKIKLNIMLGSQDKMFSLEDDLAIEFIEEYNVFLAQ